MESDYREYLATIDHVIKAIAGEIAACARQFKNLEAEVSHG
ncbi:MAG: hypothetical protein JWQ21_2524 [Herminiimonas sp.]|nr:hypothetical protein [Herminiimonas sp.]